MSLHSFALTASFAQLDGLRWVEQALVVGRGMSGWNNASARTIRPSRYWLGLFSDCGLRACYR